MSQDATDWRVAMTDGRMAERALTCLLVDSKSKSKSKLMTVPGPAVQVRLWSMYEYGDGLK